MSFSLQEAANLDPSGSVRVVIPHGLGNVELDSIKTILLPFVPLNTMLASAWFGDVQVNGWAVDGTRSDLVVILDHPNGDTADAVSGGINDDLIAPVDRQGDTVDVAASL